MQFDFQIHDIEMQVFFIEPLLFKNLPVAEMVIDKNAFFTWVQSMGLNEYIFNYYENGHKEITGKYTRESYFEIDKEDIKNDIVRFINHYK